MNASAKTKPDVCAHCRSVLVANVHWVYPNVHELGDQSSGDYGYEAENWCRVCQAHVELVLFDELPVSERRAVVEALEQFRPHAGGFAQPAEHIRCSVCRGGNVQRQYWVDPNTGAIFGPFHLPSEREYNFCDDCDSHVTVEVVGVD